MDKSILSYIGRPLKDGYQTTQESLGAKLKQSLGITEVIINHELAGEELYRLLWCQNDLLVKAITECEDLSIDDFKSKADLGDLLADKSIQMLLDEPTNQQTKKPAKKSVKRIAKQSKRLR